MSENDDPQIRQLLKKSPKLTPPESFYRGVLEKIERRTEAAKKRSLPSSLLPSFPSSLARWLSGYPAKGLATACVLVVIVLVTRQTKKSQPDLLRQVRDESFQTESKPAPSLLFSKSQIREETNPESPAPASVMKEDNAKAAKESNLKNLAQSSEVQSRLNRSIAGYVGTPSPFTELDEGEAKDRRLETRAKTKAANPWPMQARDMGGAASQGSFERGGRQDAPILAGSAGPAGQKQTVPSAPAEQKTQNSAGGRAAHLGSFGNASPMPMEWRGSSSGISTHRQVVIKTEQEWQVLWQEHMPVRVGPLVIPAVDFDHEMVIGVFSGTKPTAGHADQITDVQTLQDKVVVRYRETSPPAGAMTAQVLTQPFHLRVVPKTHLPVIFEKVQ